MKVGLYLAVVEERDDDWSVGPPLGLGYLSSYIKRYGQGYEVVIEREIEDLIAHKPDIVGISSATYSFGVATRAAELVKQELGIPTIIGGTQITAMPDRLPRAFDIGVLGEGESTFFEICELYKNERDYEPQSLEKVPGIVWHGEKGPVLNPRRAPIENMDSIPRPDRKALGDQWGEVRKHAHIMTSRGCPFRCSFCSTVQHWGTNHRFFSPEYVVEEIEELVSEWGAEHIIVFDDLFIGKKSRLEHIRNVLAERGLLDHVNFTVSARANQIREKIAEPLVDMNVKALTIGFESAAPSVLAYLAKDGVKPEQLHRTVNVCRDFGIKIDPSFIIGSPCETRDDLQMTFDFIIDSMDVFTALVIGPLMVLPDTPIWDHAVARNLIDEEKLTGVVLEPEDLMDDKKFFFEKYVYLNEQMPKEEFYMHYQMAKKLEYIVWQQAQLRREVERPITDEQLSFVPWKRLAGALGGKIKRRLTQGKVTPNTRRMRQAGMMGEPQSNAC